MAQRKHEPTIQSLRHVASSLDCEDTISESVSRAKHVMKFRQQTQQQFDQIICTYDCLPCRVEKKSSGRLVSAEEVEEAAVEKNGTGRVGADMLTSRLKVPAQHPKFSRSESLRT